MAQLKNTVKQVEYLKDENTILEKARINRHPRTKVAYVEIEDHNPELDIVFKYVEENEINLEEL